MRYIDKILSYFISNYLNNTKFKHSTLGFLKIFFEKNNKFNNIFFNLGNVFKNSKWTDFKTQNIKYTLVQQYFFLLILLIIFFLFYLNNLTFIYDSLIFLNRTISFILELITFILGGYWIIFNIFKNKLFYNNEGVLLKQVFNSTNKNDLFKISLNNNINLDIWENFNFKIFNFYKILNNLSLIQNSENINLFFLKKIHMDLNLSYLNLSTNSNWGVSNLFLLNLDNNFILNKEIHGFSDIFNLVLSPSDLNNTFSYNPDLYSNLFNVNKTFDLIKEERWLLKNSLVAQDISNYNHKVIESKKLLNFLFWNSKISDNNLWLSNILIRGNLNLNSININNTSLFTNFNYYEESLEFSIKRYFKFLSNNNLFFTKTFNLVNYSSSNRNYSTFFTLQDKYLKNQEFNQQQLLLKNNKQNYFNLIQKLNKNNLNYKYNQGGFLNNNTPHLVINLLNSVNTNNNFFIINKNF